MFIFNNLAFNNILVEEFTIFIRTSKQMRCVPECITFCTDKFQCNNIYAFIIWWEKYNPASLGKLKADHMFPDFAKLSFFHFHSQNPVILYISFFILILLILTF